MTDDPEIHLDTYSVHGEEARRAVFDGLLRDDLHDRHVGVDTGVKVLWDLLEYGGELPMNMRASSERDEYREYPVLRKRRRRLRVLALDLAAVPPVSSAGARTGRIFYDCLVDAKTGNDWYKTSLDRYFLKDKTSLLSLDVVQREHTTCRLATWKTAASQHGRTKRHITARLHPKRSAFRYTTVYDRDVDERFNDYCNSINGTIDPHVLTGLGNTLAVLWMHVGLPQAHDIKGDNGVLWSVSLFATMIVSERETVLPADGPSKYSRARTEVDALWSPVIDAVHQFLALGAHETFEQYRTERLRALTGQTIAHEFKNLTRDISHISAPMYWSLKGISERMTGMCDQFAKVVHDAHRLKMLSYLTNAMQLATYSLTRHRIQDDYIFHSDENCDVLLAVTRLALALCAGSKRSWTLADADLDDALEMLTQRFGENDPTKLLYREDIALMLFVVFEPVRNLRNPQDSHERPMGVRIETRAEPPYVIIKQTTCELVTERPDDAQSTSSEQINQVLGRAMGKHIFAEIEPIVRVLKYEQRTPERAEVVRETRIRVRSFPVMNFQPTR